VAERKVQSGKKEPCVPSMLRRSKSISVEWQSGGATELKAMPLQSHFQTKPKLTGF
jgi:hypothetical protein